MTLSIFSYFSDNSIFAGNFWIKSKGWIHSNPYVANEYISVFLLHLRNIHTVVYRK